MGTHSTAAWAVAKALWTVAKAWTHSTAARAKAPIGEMWITRIGTKATTIISTGGTWIMVTGT